MVATVAPARGNEDGVLLGPLTSAQWVVALIVVTLPLRLLFAVLYGLGVDESYMVAAGRQLQLSYFDHPPLAWWLSWGSANLFGGESDLVVRLPFILIFMLATWLMYRLGAVLLSPKAGLWAAVLLNVVPVLGFTAASWVVPDGPLDCALLGFALCFSHGVRAAGRAAAGWWLAAGFWAGLAMLAKYSAVLTLFGAAVYLVSQPEHRVWLKRPWPWLGALLSLALFAPVLIWNGEHAWVSFAFQTGRAAGHHLHPAKALVTLAGEALFLMPWIWLPLMLSLVRALRVGTADAAGWLLVCLGTPPVALFTLIAAWTHEHVLFHWAAPGYMMFLPLLGAACARRLKDGRGRWVRVWLIASAAFLLFGAGLVGSEVRWNWLSAWDHRYTPGHDPVLAAVDWDSLKLQLAGLGLLAPGGPIFAATRWVDAGKIDYALGGDVPVICLGPDPRQYGMVRPVANYAGRDVVIVAPFDKLAYVREQFGKQFASIEELPALHLLHGGQYAMDIPIFLGRRLNP